MIDVHDVLTRPESIRDVKREARRILDVCGYVEHLSTLRKYGDWSKFDWSVMASWANSIDDVFVRLMIGLSKRKYTYNVISMHRWWRRLKACNQQNIIAFFTYIGFVQPGFIDWGVLYAHCCRTKSVFDEMLDVYKSDKSVELNLRALLGISMQKDIEQAWRKWAKENHPDKGGSEERFVLVKAAYEEWHETINTAKRCSGTTTD